MELAALEMLLPGFALVLARIAGLMLSMPLLSSSQIPWPVKMWLTVTIALMAWPTAVTTLPDSLTLGQTVAGMAMELVIGEIIGLGAGVVFFAAQFAGHLISHQTGLVLGEVVNPVFDSESTVFDQLWFFTAMMFFLALRGHLAVVQIVLGSFEQIPPIRMIAEGPTAEFCVAMLTTIFETAMRLAGPTILALLLALLALGMLSKTMPQLNVLNVGFSLKTALAFFVAAITLFHARDVMGDAVMVGLDSVGRVFEDVSNQVMNAV